MSTLPAGFMVESLDLGTAPAQFRMHLVGPEPDDDLQVHLAPSPLAAEPTGEPTNRRRLSARRWQHLRLCGSAFVGDTGPHLDRSDQVPTIDAVARELSFADLDNPQTWFTAHEALP